MEKFISQNSKVFSISSHPVKVNGQECVKITLTKSEQKKFDSGKYIVARENGKLIFTAIPENPIKQEKQALKAKIEQGTATDEDIKEALKLLL